LAAAVSWTHAVRELREALGEPEISYPIFSSAGTPQWKIVDYAHVDKIDAPSGTARELPARLSRVRESEPAISVQRTVGERNARGQPVSRAGARRPTSWLRHQ
jgi:hypothetical protein